MIKQENPSSERRGFFACYVNRLSFENPDWLEIAIEINPVAHEAVSAFLFDLGCTGVVTQNFQDHALRTFLPFSCNLEETRNRIVFFFEELKAFFPEVLSPKLALSPLEKQDWGRTWRRFFHSERVTPGLMIVPVWEKMPSCFDGEVIRMDPGPAFGTGKHPTTRMCLEAMEKIVLPGSWTMLDVGTGSGILAIYGARLGAGRIVGIDTDPEALKWAERNIELNGLSGAIVLSNASPRQLTESFSVVLANLIFGVILELLPQFSQVVDPGGWLILSGILQDQVEEVLRGLNVTGFSETQVLHQEEWACLVSRKRPVS